MLLINRDQERPSSVTGLSLVLFLFLSLLSMMAAYEASKPSDDIRSNVIASLHEYNAQAADAESGDQFQFVETAWSALPQFHLDTVFLPGVRFALAATSRAFDARGPPGRFPAAS